MEKTSYVVKVHDMYVADAKWFLTYSDNHVVMLSNITDVTLKKHFSTAKEFSFKPVELLKVTGGQLIKVQKNLTEVGIDDD